MKLALAAAGATLDAVVTVTVYPGDVDDRPKDNTPASMLIEIEAIAVTR